MTHKNMVSIDFWNTLVDPLVGSDERYNARIDAINKVANRHNKSINAEQVEETFSAVSDHFHDIWLNEHRTPKSNELTSLLLEHLEIPATKNDISELSELIQQSLLKGPPALAPNAREVITELAQKYNLVIISDTMYTPGKVLREYLTGRDMAQFFSGYVFSDEKGYSKPDTRAFSSALDIAQSKAESSSHIGDLEHTDIAGAKASGMQALLYVGLAGEEPEETSADHVTTSWQHAGDILL